MFPDNPCFKCKENCCLRIHDRRDFHFPYPKQEQIDSNQKSFLKAHPQFKVVDQEVIETKPVTTIPIYNCQLLTMDLRCSVHDTLKDPICLNAGISYPPTENCELYYRNHPKPNKRSFLLELFGF